MKDTNDATVDAHPAAAHVRALFISDVHLGTRTAQAEQLLDLLRSCDADVIYLVGDIIDFWRVRRGPHWPQSHNDVLQKLMRKVRKGTRLILIPGNHDEGLRDYAGMQFGGLEIHRDHVHVTAQGRRYVVMHGDEFDLVVRTAKWLALLGDRGYELALWLNNPLNWVRRHLGLGYWSLSAYLKNRVKKAVAFIGAFEEAVAAEARRRDADGIVCGHIHHAADRTFEGVHYLNCGDWVESCTAIIESHAGELQVIHWADGPFDAEPARNGFPLPFEPVGPPAGSTLATSRILSPAPCAEGAGTGGDRWLPGLGPETAARGLAIPPYLTSRRRCR